jgi:hypothetical protein
MPGLNASGPAPNPFSGIRKAGQAKRAMNFEKFSQNKNTPGTLAPEKNDAASFAGAKNQLMGGAQQSQFGSTRPAKF